MDQNEIIVCSSISIITCISELVCIHLLIKRISGERERKQKRSYVVYFKSLNEPYFGDSKSIRINDV